MEKKAEITVQMNVNLGRNEQASVMFHMYEGETKENLQARMDIVSGLFDARIISNNKKTEEEMTRALEESANIRNLRK